MKSAIYAGSFDPWSFGHQFVLDSCLQVFDAVHVVAAVNPTKPGTLTTDLRARVIACAIDPYTDWWSQGPLHKIRTNIFVSSTQGLVVDYARKHGINTLIRGLRSTSDFEAEFNLYFSNRAIEPDLQTWAVMCPPELLHCSSTYVRAVVGNPGVRFVGTTFLAQSLILGRSRTLGELFDLILASSAHRFECEPADLTVQDLYHCLQETFTRMVTAEGIALPAGGREQKAAAALRAFRASHGAAVRDIVEKGGYPLREIGELWKMVAEMLAPTAGEPHLFETLRLTGVKLGKAEIPLIDAQAAASLVLGSSS